MKILAILRKELQTYFYSPAAYIVFASFLLVVGYLFWVVLIASKVANLEPLLYNAAFILLLASPVLTMRLISEERRTNTIELLLTSPISPVEIVIGKFLACFLLYLILIVLTFQYPAILHTYAQNLDWGPIISGYIGLILLGAAYIAFGLFASSVTENQVISAMLTFGGLLLFWIVGWTKNVLDNVYGDALSRLSLLERYSEFLKGMVDSGNVVFFLIFTITWLFVATRVLESDRWR
ncbi:MAG: ABC-type transport system involved in multi-copper enzyme maturation, permease component [Candidatus Ozemobacter sibiricus]|jgi:ABC-2 type transport system permease protein|uniref:ABC-type transport system involved in multi-copper enzyme maturation, permease component n=1 Tax=Candidatus Ozemobacter sibiricus TaxID=2268124 RepID=A0A367ZJY9_9BACT|nr:MAG: ABC-type transport system involved in multi-copper enzyme maturation, permease component [Candidatus Ozemobacter sibiricus]